MARNPAPFFSIARCSGFPRLKGDGKPQRLLKELAEEFGLNVQQLQYRMATSKVKPPVARQRTAKGLWYEPVAFRAWYKAHLKSLDEPSPSDII